MFFMKPDIVNSYFEKIIIPKVKIAKNPLLFPASMHIHNAQTKGTQHMSMVNQHIKRDNIKEMKCFSCFVLVSLL